jgi:putative phage-type endonuclease
MTNDTQYIKRPTDRADWLAARRGFVGGSEVAALCGLSPWKTAIDIFLDKSGRAPDEGEPSEALRLGIELEDYAARRYTETTGRAVRNYGFMVVRGHALADVDRLIVPDGEKVAAFREEVRTDGILECKTSGMLWDNDEPPPHYQAQAQLYAELLDCAFVDFAVVFLAPRRDFRVYRVERDREVGAELLRRIEAFWTRCIVPDDAEAVTPFVRSLADARSLFPHGGGEAKEADADTAGRIRALRQTESDIKQLTAHADKLKGEIAAAMGDADALTVDGKTVCTFKAPKPTDKIDFKAAFQDLALALHADPMQTASIVSKHRTLVNGARRFLLKAEKGGAE